VEFFDGTETNGFVNASKRRKIPIHDDMALPAGSDSPDFVYINPGDTNTDPNSISIFRNAVHIFKRFWDLDSGKLCPYEGELSDIERDIVDYIMDKCYITHRPTDAGGNVNGIGTKEDQQFFEFRFKTSDDGTYGYASAPTFESAGRIP